MKYVSDGTFIGGIPARDLSQEEVEKFGEKYLLSTKLYEKEKVKVEETKNGRNQSVSQDTVRD